jgi:hypothetical protein
VTVGITELAEEVRGDFQVIGQLLQVGHLDRMTAP